jgi:hypothetical protein
MLENEVLYLILVKGALIVNILFGKFSPIIFLNSKRLVVIVLKLPIRE